MSRFSYFGWSQRRVGDDHIICLTGELDRDAVTELRAWLTGVAASSTAPTIVLDLSGLSFIDAGCGGVVLNACAAATSRGRRLRVAGLHGVPETVFAILGWKPPAATPRDGLGVTRDRA